MNDNINIPQLATLLIFIHSPLAGYNNIQNHKTIQQYFTKYKHAIIR